MLVLERGYNSVVTIPIETTLLEKGHIFLEGEINEELSNSMIKQIMYLVNCTEIKDIFIHVDSLGGDIRSGLLLYDVIQSYAERIYMICTGKAYSMAAILVACGAKGRRFILPGSEIMLHEPLISSGISGSCSSIKASSERLNEYKELVIKILSKHTGKSKSVINKAISNDNYFSADKSVAFGLCDRIIDFKELTGGFADE